MYQTKNDLPQKTREAVVELCNQTLADFKDLQTQAKQAHWNVKGDNFIALHELFDEINTDVDEYVDLVAERAVQLGGHAMGTARVVAGKSRLPEYPLAAVDSADHVEALGNALAAAAKIARDAVEVCDEVDDVDSEDIFTEISRGLDKWLWMVEAHPKPKKD